MNIFIAVLYGLTMWLSTLSYYLIAGGPWGIVLIAAPWIVSGAAAFILLLDLVVWWLTGLLKAAYFRCTAPTEKGSGKTFSNSGRPGS